MADAVQGCDSAVKSKTRCTLSTSSAAFFLCQWWCKFTITITLTQHSFTFTAPCFTHSYSVTCRIIVGNGLVLYNLAWKGAGLSLLNACPLTSCRWQVIRPIIFRSLTSLFFFLFLFCFVCLFQVSVKFKNKGISTFQLVVTLPGCNPRSSWLLSFVACRPFSTVARCIPLYIFFFVKDIWKYFFILN